MTNLPSSPDAERGILSACLQWPQKLDTVALAGGGALFYVPAHKALWRALTAMHGERVQISLVTVIAKLTQSKKIDSVGGPGYLAELFDDVPTSAILPDLLTFAKDSLMRRQIHELAENAIRQARDMAIKPEDAAQSIDTGMKRILASVSEDGLKTWGRVLSDFIEDLQARFEDGGKSAGTPTGFPILDEMTGGIHAGQLWVIGARPGAGKTAFAFQVAENIARRGIPVAFFSAEMLAIELATRAVAAESRIDSLKIQNGYLKKPDLPKIAGAVQRLMGNPIYVDDRANMRLIDIKVGLRRAVTEHGVKVAFVDYLQLLKEEDGSRNREDAVRRLSNGLKQLGKELGVGIVALAQLNRASDGKEARPKPSNLRDSGSIEQDANTILLLHPESKTQTLAIVAKVRGGKRGDILMDFDGPSTRFAEASNQPDENDD